MLLFVTGLVGLVELLKCGSPEVISTTYNVKPGGHGEKAAGLI